MLRKLFNMLWRKW